jgi:putative membrane protein
MKKITLFLILGSIIALKPAKAQTMAQDTATENFIVKASVGGLQEIADGKLAMQKATDPEVKAFAARMVADHSRAQEKLLQVAKQERYTRQLKATVAVPDMMLEKATGKEFDQMYVHMMVPGHRSTASLFEKYALTGKDPQVKAFAAETLPTIKQHLTTITAIDEKLK